MIKRDYNITLDLNNSINNSVMKFDDTDINTSSFKIFITRSGATLDINDIQGTLYTLSPTNKKIDTPIENKDKYFYINLPLEFTSEKGIYRNEISMVRGDKRTITDTFEYEVV